MAARPLRVLAATPLGKAGRGGMDRLIDVIVEHLEATSSAAVAVERLTTKGERGKLLGVLVFVAALVRLAGLGLAGRIDVLHLNVAADGSFYRKYLLARLAALLGIPYLVHIHTGRFERFWDGAGRLVSGWIIRLMRESAGIIVLGRSFETLVASRLPDVRDKIIVLPNATTGRPRAAGSGRPGVARITFLGVIMREKGVPQLVAALGSLGGRRDWTATLAGYGDLAGVRDSAAQLGIGDRVDLPGWVDARAVGELLASTDIFVLPSFSEGLPMSILEAFAAGIAVIATPLNAIRDVVEHERNGLLVPVGDAAALAAALERLLEDPELRLSLGAAARADHAARYEIGAYVRRMLAVWRVAALRKAPAAGRPSSARN